MSFTFRNADGTLYFVRVALAGDRMDFQLGTIDGIVARYVFLRQ